MNKNIEYLLKEDILKTPSYVIDEEKLIYNLEILKELEKKTGAHILLAQKCFSMFSLYPLISSYVSGCTASGLYEARLGYEEMGKENHVFSVAYTRDEVIELDSICDHIIFNSESQWESLSHYVKNASIGLRLNPEYSTQEEHKIYDPCSEGSRMGIPVSKLNYDLLDKVDGIHIHTLCEQDSLDLISTFKYLEANLKYDLSKLKWINLGGGHHITKDGYHLDELINLILYIKNKYHVEVYLEPGEAFAYYAGYLITSIIDISNNSINNIIVDTSASCHMPDVIEMPYRPPLYGESQDGEPYRIGSRTCLAGDIIGDYRLINTPRIGDKLAFLDMAIYTMVKNNTFNGMPLPSIYLLKKNNELSLIKEFSYDDFKSRLS